MNLLLKWEPCRALVQVDLDSPVWPQVRKGRILQTMSCPVSAEYGNEKSTLIRQIARKEDKI